MSRGKEKSRANTVGVKLGRVASRLAARHRAATEIRQLYQFNDRELRDAGQAPYAVLSVGGALGMGTKYVVVPFTNCR